MPLRQIGRHADGVGVVESEGFGHAQAHLLDVLSHALLTIHRLARQDLLFDGARVFDVRIEFACQQGIPQQSCAPEFALVFGRASGRLDNLLQHVSEDDTLGKALGTDLDRRFLGRSDAGQTQEHDQPSAHQLTSSPNTWSAVRWALMNLSTKGSAGLLKRSANVPRWMIRPSRINTI